MLNNLVSTQWLSENLDNDRLVLLDATLAKIVGKKEILYEAPTFIDKSRKLDIDKSMYNKDSSLINAFPTEKQFNRVVSELGINTDSLIVIYDNQGIYSSPRGWWIFKSMGFNDVFVLDGGLPQWLLENRATISELNSEIPKLGNFEGSFKTQSICDSEYVLDNLNNESTCILDARAKERFLGQVEEPREGIESGHIPSSLNLPFGDLLENHCFKSKESLTPLFNSLSNNNPKKLIFSCGSGLTACIILLGAHIAGHNNLVLYDGSWSEWGGNPQLPKEKS